MRTRIREMPPGVALFLVYAFLILAGIGISLRFVIDLAIGAPVSPVGVVVMVLLAYTIFTTTLVLQRKEASRGLALGLASLTVPLAPYLLLTVRSSLVRCHGMHVDARVRGCGPRDRAKGSVPVPNGRSPRGTTPR